jgi:transposase
MDYFAGLDVSVKETSVCIVDDAGKIVREARVASEPEALLQVLTNTIYRFKRVGLEAGPLSQWLYSVLAEAGLPVICVETRHMRAVLKAQINKTDRNDARGLAQMMRVGLYRPVHVKTLRSQKLRMLLTHRKLLQSKAIAIENDLRATLRNFGLKVGIVGTVKFEARIKELVENLPDVAVRVEPLLVVRRVLREQVGILHRRLLAIVRDDDVCRLDGSWCRCRCVCRKFDSARRKASLVPFHSRRDCNPPAGDDHPLASRGVPDILALAIRQSCRQTEDLSRTAQAHWRDEPRKSPLGCATHPW